MKVKEVKDIPKEWSVISARKNTTVKIRPSLEVEKFKVSWQDAELTSDPEVDLIVIQPNGKEYPCKKDIFWETYDSLRDSDGSITGDGLSYVKKALCTLVVIPEGVEVEIETLEGTLPKVTFPDYIAIGPKGELYANTKEFVEQNMTLID